MKYFLTITVILFSVHLISGQSCADTNIYANSKQTRYDDRFYGYKKIKSVPKYKGGAKKLEQFIRDNLVVDPRFKNEIFNLNYQVTISCDGEIVDAKTLGDKRFGEITNFIEIIQTTKGSWKPAKSKGRTVNCIYFGRMFINGSLYQL